MLAPAFLDTASAQRANPMGGGCGAAMARPAGANRPAMARPDAGARHMTSGNFNRPGYYNDRDRYRDDDHNLLEFVGKTAAVSVVSAAIGSVVKDKPSNDRTQQVHNGQSHMVCNGVWYSSVPSNSAAAYQVVAAPR